MIEDLYNNWVQPKGFAGDVDEYRITGDPGVTLAGRSFPEYDFTWRGPQAYEKAHAFYDRQKDKFVHITLSHRIVTYEPWIIDDQHGSANADH